MSAAGKPKSDLAVRAASGVVMIAVAGGALWIGGLVLTALLAVVGAIAIFELIAIGRVLPWGATQRVVLVLTGILYVASAAAALIMFRMTSVALALFPITITIATDVGAYFTGRSIGGPKIASKISPSKTWAGLGGGMIAAGVVALVWFASLINAEQVFVTHAFAVFMVGAALAVIAQAGDFGESFVKRRAGVKDSGTLIPGHGGVLDRIDGLLAVLVACLIGWLKFGFGVQ